jgi:Undecaprenyl-phosphate galactose phosphotransferase WbaP
MRILHPTVLILMFTDILSLSGAGGLAYFCRTLFPASLDPGLYLKLVPWFFLFIPLYAVLALYPGFTLPKPDYLKRLSAASSLGFLFIGAVLLLSLRNMDYSRVILLLSWFFSLFSVPLFRYLAENIFGRFHWWGYPVLIFGHPDLAGEFYDRLRRYGKNGFRPLAVFVPEDPGREGSGGGRPEVGQLLLSCGAREVRQQLRPYKNLYPRLLPVVMLDKIPPETQRRLLRSINDNFSRLLLVPDGSFNMRMSVRVADFCGQLALGLRHNLKDAYRLRLKRLLDVFLALLLAPPLFPLILLVYAAVRLDSPGPGFYRHTRLGRGGREIKILKFRTMYENADALLSRILETTPEMRREWEKGQKIRRDPRITRVGRFLRKFSLDELPQIINVFGGSMSFVGPRPIVAREIPRYGVAYNTYMQVTPGITGLWQVSGRSDISYAARVALDEYYVANWSVWLDIYILARTLPAVLRRDGAY